MQINVTKKTDRKINFVLEDSHAGFANALRRIMVGEIPILAVEYVDFEENTSGLFDEIIAHRLAMLPLKFDPKMFNLKSDCKCKGKGCSRCEATLTLEAKGPGTVKSGELIGKSVQPLEKEAPIVDLTETQNLKLQATAQLGLGKEHAKWQAATVGYKKEKDRFVFNVESVCGLNAEEVLKMALDIIASRSEEFLEDFKKALK